MYWINVRELSARQRRALHSRSNKPVGWLVAALVVIPIGGTVTAQVTHIDPTAPNIGVWAFGLALLALFVVAGCYGWERSGDADVKSAILKDRRLSAGPGCYSFDQLMLTTYRPGEITRYVSDYFDKAAEHDMLNTDESRKEIDKLVKNLRAALEVARYQ